MFKKTGMAGKALDRVRELYEGDSDKAHRFRYGLLCFDVVTILFVIATSFTEHGRTVAIIDLLFGVVFLADFVARFLISRARLRFVANPYTIADIASIVSFLAPLAGEGLGFLRIVRTLRFLRTYHLLSRLRDDVPFFRRYQDEFVAALNLLVFVFVMTGLVYATQHGRNPQITNYADSLYFTVTALTTTGFGDITLEGSLGRLISVVVMIFGVTLFLRLAQVLFRPAKVRETCHRCGLSLHDRDAVHCKHCGELIHIATEGET